MQNLISLAIENVDYDTASSWEDYSDAQRYVNNLINELGNLSSFEQDKITAYLEIQTKYNGNECTVKEYNTAIDDFNNAISDLNEDTQNQIKVALGFEDDTTQFERVKNKFSEEYYDWIDSLTKTELNIVENLLLDTSSVDWNLEQWKSKVEGQNSIEIALNFNIENAEKNVETLQKSVQEALTGNYGLSKESRSVFTSLLGSLDSFDSAKLFERTAGGIRLNTEELSRLQNEQSSIQKQKFDIALEELYKEYNELTDKIKDCSDIQGDEYNSLVDSRNAIVDQITSIADLQSEYNGLTSAYLEWQNALANGEDGDMYDNIRSEYEKAKELYDKRLVGTSEFESYMDLVHPRDNGESWGSASYDEIIKGWQEVGKEIQNTGYSIQDFLKDDEKGVMNFLEATSKIKDSGITKDGNFFNIDVENTEELAKRLGVSVDFIETMFKKLKDYKFDINFYDESEEYLRSVSVALEAAQKLKDLKLTDINFDFTTTDTESLIKQIETIAKVYDKFKKSDGSIDLSIEGAVEAKEVYTQLLRQKQKLEAPIYMSIDTSQVNDNGVRDKLQEVKDITKTYNEIELKAILGDDTSELERQLNKQIRDAVKNKNSVLYGVTFEADEVSYAEVEEKINEYFGTDDGKALLISAGVDSAQLEDEAKTLKSTIQNALSGITIRLGFDKNGLKFTIDTSEADKDVKKFQNQTEKRVFIPALDLDTSGAEKQANTFFSGLQNQLNKKYTATVNVNTFRSPTLDNLSKNSDSGYKKSILYQGIHKLQGTAKADGDWGAKKTEDSLLGEIAPELWVHSDTGTWELVDKPQFRKVKKGDVIFNGNQTKDLMKRGIINSFGQSFLNGTAYGNGVGGGGSVIVSTGSSGNSNTSSKSSSNSKSTSKDKEEELKAFDWIEVAIDRIERAIDRLKNTATSTYKAFKTKLGATTSEISKVNQELSLQQKAYNRYIKEANSVGLSSGLATKVRNGTIDINKYSSETQELIKDYQEWYEKALDCKDAIQDLHEALASLYEDKFNDIQNDYDNQLGLSEHLINTYNIGIDELEAKGYLESTKYYSALQNVEKQNIAIMNKELKDLEKSFSEAMNSGEIEKYSDSWYDMQISINDVKESIDEANASLLEYSKTMREIEWGYFDYIQDRIGQIAQESDFLIDLMSNDKLHKDNGQFNNNGMATTGLHAQNYNVYMAQADMYAKEIEKLNKDISKDPYNTDLIERREELLKLQQDSILSAEDEKNAIVDLVEEGINIELDALKELIDTYKDSLDNAKDLYDYQKKIEDKTKNIASLQKQLSAYENDTSEETKAKLQQIRVELAEAQEDLEETEYEKYISDQKKLLDDMYTEYETILNMRLDDIDALIADMIEMVNNNADTISTTISEESDKVGYTLTEAMQNIWNGNISNVVTKYGDNFITQLTTVNQVLSSIQANVAAMANASNKEASKTISSTSKETKPAQTNSSSKTNTSTTSQATSKSKSITKGGKINAAGAKIYDYAGDKTGEKQYYSKDPKYTVLKVQGDWVQVRHHSLKSGVTGWFKKGDVKAYKTGGLVDYTGLAQLDGTPSKPELVLNANDTKNFLALTEALRNMPAESLIPKDFGYPNHLAEIRKISDISNKIMSARNIADNQGAIFGDINIEIPIEHVENYNDIVRQMQKDNQFAKMIQDVTVNRVMGGNSLAKNRHRW